MFLGTHIGAVVTAGRFGITPDRFGIAPDRAQDFHANAKGVELNFRVMSEIVASFREQAAMPAIEMPRSGRIKRGAGVCEGTEGAGARCYGNLNPP